MASRLKKKPSWNGKSFKSLFNTPPSQIDTVKIQVNSSDERKCVTKETLVNAEKMKEEKVQTSKFQVSDSNTESRDVGSNCGDTATLSKRKRDSCTDLHASSQPETSDEFETCVACSKRQRLCNGKYCKTSCNSSSLDPCTGDVLVGVWQCFQCLNSKMQNSKMQAGACPLSANIEAIWNARETEISDAEGLRKEKQYFVKYRGLAHIHNQWISESWLSPEAEKLIEEFNKERKAVKWNEEWVVPQRLLKKRLLSLNQENNAPPGTSSCYYEWLVKWCGLDYKSVTWELDSFLSSVHGANLIKEYENRHKKALDDSSSVDKDKNGPLVKLQKLPAGSPPGSGTSHLETVNKLREFMHKGQSAIVFDDKDRIMKTLLYILSLSDISQPFLIITTSSLLPLWEAEFLRAVPFVDIVVYNGNSDNRECIRTLEFNDDDGRIMLQVLLSSVEVVVEDFLFLDSIKWKVVIVDESQQPKVSSQFPQIKVLAADVKILLHSGLLKDNVNEYLSLLSMLEHCGDSINIDELKAESVDNLCKLKERLSRYIAYEGKSSPSKFVEFWVPSIISNVQLEQYCDTLLSNSISLRSYSRTDPVGALRDIVFSTRKSCDHPYIVNPSLKHLITKDLPPVSFLDAEIKSSGKLQLLEMILTEIKKRQLRVLILFQSVAGSGRDTLGLGDILDDFLRERFGADTYERVDGGMFPSKSRQTALSNFNKGNGRFMFLLENRACLPSIKLVSVDTIIIYDSDWNPAHDVKALNRISIDSKSKKIKIFRLYSAFTVEEKVLILAKQGLTLESNLESITRANSNTLLMWGASYLLDRLNEFHSTPDKNVSSEQELSSKVVDEISTLLSRNGECDNVDNSCILKIQQRGGIYSSSLKLLGEQQIQLSDDGHPHDFWTNLLNRRILKWKFLSGRTQRHRKTVQYSDYIPKNAECGTLEARKKRKNGETKVNPTILNPELERDKTGGASGIRGDYGLCCSKLLHPSKVPTIVSEKSTLPNAKMNIDLVKTDLLKLCAILNFSDEVKIMAERLLDYVVSKHHVKSGSESLSHAFLIALCWGSASLLKQKINRTDSLLLAKKHLNFSCSEIEAESVYISAVRKFKKTFEENMLSDLSDSSISGVKKSIEGKLTENKSQLQTVKPELEDIRDQVHTGDISLGDETHEVETENNFDLIHRKCKKRIEKLKQKQEEEIHNMNEYWEVQRAEIESKQKVESIVYAEVFRQPIITDKLKVSDNKWRMRLEELEHQKEIRLEELKAKHLDALSNERSKAAQWLKSASPASFAAKVAGQDELALHLSGIQNGEYSQASKILFSNVFEDDNQDVRCNDLDVITENPNCEDDEVKNMVSENVPVARSQLPNGLGSPANGLPVVSENDSTLSKHADDFATDTNIVKMVPGSICVDPNQDARCNSLNGILTITEKMNCKDGELQSMASKNVPVAKSQQPNGLGSATNGLENSLSVSLHHSENQNPDKTMSSGSGGMILPETPERILEEVTDQIVEVNPLDEDQEGHLAENHPESLQEMVEDAEELPSQVQHIGSNVELLPPTDVMENPVQQNQPDLPSTSTFDQQPLVENTSLPNSEAVPRIIGRTTELPRQPVIPTRVNMSVVQGFQDLPLRAEHQAPSQILKLTSCSDPLQNELQEMVEDAEELPSQVQHIGSNVELLPPTDVMENPVQQNQPDLPSTSTFDHQPLIENTSLPNSEAVPRIIGRTTELPRQPVIPTRVDMSVVQGFQDLPLRAEHQAPSQILKLTSCSDPLQNELQEMVEDAEELPSQVQHIGSNVELLPPTDVMENPVQQNQPDLPSTSTFDQQPLIENTSLPNSEAVPRIIGRTTELPRQPVIPTRVDMSVVQGFQDLPLHAEHQAPSQILKLTSCSDPLQNELERIHKENEQAIKLQEDAKMRLRSEFEELMAQLHRKFEDKCKDLDVVFQLKKDELDKKHSRVLMSKMLADAFRSKCAEPSRFSEMQKGVHHGLVQPLNQVPMSAASRSSAITSSSAGQPAGSQQNTVSISQPSSSVQPNVTPTTCQPAASPQNTVLLSQHGTRLLPVIASSSGSQPAVKQQCTTQLMQPEPGVQPAASQRSAPPLQIVQQSAALFSSTPTRHPRINPITPSMGNLRIGSENRARAPAPHLQAFRSASSINLVSTLVMPSHLTQNSPSMSSHPLHGPPCPSPSKPPN